jgi:hypothetical protein
MKLTSKQQRTLDLFLELGSKKKVAQALCVNESTVRRSLSIIEAKGFAPWFSGAVIPEHLKVAKTTVEYGPDGEVKREWKRLIPNHETMTEFVDSLCQRIKGKIQLPKPTSPSSLQYDENVLAEICCFDAHIGMYASASETNDIDYNSDVATKRIHNTTAALLGRLGNPAELVVTFGGDMLHSDTRNNTTEKSNNPLDVDSRYQAIVDKAVAVCYDVVAMAAEVAKNVTVVILEGNHSWHSEVWLAKCLEYGYMDCDNVKIVRQKSARKTLIWGNNLLVWTHGDNVAMNKWQGVISTEFAKEWGNTKYRHLKMGHVHHKKAKTAKSVVTYDDKSGWIENHGLLVEYLPALTATDAWHAANGFIGSQKAMTGFQYHKDHGLITRLYEPAH